MAYQNIEDKLFERLNKKHEKDIEAKIPDLRDKQIYNSLPDNEPFQDQSAIRVIKAKTNLEEQEIINSLNRLIKKGKLVTSVTLRRNQLYLRKNPFK